MRVELQEFSKFGDHMTVFEFLEVVDCGGFIDYDGFGHLATAEQESRVDIIPSTCRKTLSQNPWATHVMWFNR